MENEKSLIIINDQKANLSLKDEIIAQKEEIIILKDNKFAELEA